MKTSLEVGQQENCILCRQNYKKKDNNKWYTKLQKKGVQNTILVITIGLLVLIGGYIMKYILDATYTYLDIGINYEEFPEHINSNSSLWDINIYDDSSLSQDNCFIQPPENPFLYPEENIIYNIEETIEDSLDIVLHEVLFSKHFLRGINILSNIVYHIMAGMFFWGSIEMVVKHHFNRGLKCKPLLLITIIYFWWIYCSAAFEDLIGMNEYSIAQKFETIILLKDGWVPELVEYLLFIAKWTLRIVTMELDQILNFEEE
ncbi:hypothetical protein PIROE2DRAFT_10073 [Piromyces sp. E2]|nr:hypothetical protein PIROE2DRAFT_10073 [Piromyces sp. E2]|eukprot:OUM63412.1 hypothetical protein PIROE2DRAFT_10073 [Piromyces sp. E2]